MTLLRSQSKHLWQLKFLSDLPQDSVQQSRKLLSGPTESTRLQITRSK
jgi:hypothetical protein